MIDKDRLFNLLHDVLAAVETHYASEGVTLPDRRYVANGDQQIAADCEQLTVAHARTTAQSGDVTLGATSPFMRDPAHTMRAAQVAITIWRCAPSPSGAPPNIVLPTAGQEQDSALELYADQQLIENAVLAAQNAGLIGSCNSVGFLDAQTPGTQGGYASAKVRLYLGME